MMPSPDPGQRRRETHEPLVPQEVDLTDFPFMPIMIARLKQSRAWLLCKRRPQLAFYMINLWTGSWHGRPAASLENDDLVLADIAMCPDKTWKSVKSDVMRGWMLGTDGRLYHPVIAEKALEAWQSKLRQRWMTECARIKKYNQRHKTDISCPSFEQWTGQGHIEGRPASVPLDVPGDSLETRSSKGEGREVYSPIRIGTDPTCRLTTEPDSVRPANGSAVAGPHDDGFGEGDLNAA